MLCMTFYEFSHTSIYKDDMKNYKRQHKILNSNSFRVNLIHNSLLLFVLFLNVQEFNHFISYMHTKMFHLKYIFYISFQTCHFQVFTFYYLSNLSIGEFHQDFWGTKCFIIQHRSSILNSSVVFIANLFYTQLRKFLIP